MVFLLRRCFQPTGHHRRMISLSGLEVEYPVSWAWRPTSWVGTWSSSGWVEPQSSIRALVQRLLERLPGGVVKDRGQFAGDLGPVRRWHGRPCGDAAAREPVEVDGLEAGRPAVDPLVAA